MKNSSMQCSLYLMRHGQLTEKEVLAGQTDFLLSTQGELDLQQAYKKLPRIEHVFSSPLARCRLFAEEITQDQKDVLHVDKRLQEMNFGTWDGQPFKTLWQLNKDEGPTIGDFWQNPWLHSPPNGESMAAFVERVSSWWQAWLAQAYHGNSLVITHAGVIKQLLGLITGLNLKENRQQTVFDIPYAGVIHVQVYMDETGQVWPKIVF